MTDLVSALNAPFDKKKKKSLNKLYAVGSFRSSIICLFANRNSWKTGENLQWRLQTVDHFHLKFCACHFLFFFLFGGGKLIMVVRWWKKTLVNVAIGLCTVVASTTFTGWQASLRMQDGGLEGCLEAFLMLLYNYRWQWVHIQDQAGSLLRRKLASLAGSVVVMISSLLRSCGQLLTSECTAGIDMGRPCQVIISDNS